MRVEHAEDVYTTGGHLHMLGGYLRESSKLNV